jgi:RNA polymerase sigma factor (sigma-70 family)
MPASEEEVERAVAALRARLVRIAARIVGRDEAEDVVQITTANAYRNRDRIGNLDAYLVTQVKDDAKNYVSSLHREDSIGRYLDREDPRPEVITEDDLIARVDVERALTALPEDIRRAVCAVYVDGISWDAAAKEAGVPRQTLQKRVEKWLPYLREMLE